ncbi:aldo/keto reductase [Lysinimonas soli]|uniref:Aldo/keto reductase n=1 Tax=Lysinimonas soli TaxID=1074233 RepID=A0ABW0NLQ6_9MICO
MSEAAGEAERSGPSSAVRTGPVHTGRLRTDAARHSAVPTTAETAAIVGSAAAPRRRVGLSELRVFPLAISGKVFGWRTDPVTTESILDVYAAHGGNFVDTADSYASGRSEFMIGNWMRARRNRDEIIVATKVGKSAEYPGVTAPAITAAVEASLRRLRTDRLDLLYLHIDDPEVAFEETLLAVDELIRAGKVRYFGGSDHTGNRLFEARIASAQLGVAPMVALQNRYNLMDRRGYEGELEHIADRIGLGVMPRFALANGFLTGRYRGKADLVHAQRAADVAGYLTRRGFKVLAALDRIAAAHDAAVPTIALAWLLSKPNVVAPVASASSPDQVFDLVAAAEVRLTRHELTLLDRVSESRR